MLQGKGEIHEVRTFYCEGQKLWLSLKDKAHIFKDQEWAYVERVEIYNLQKQLDSELRWYLQHLASLSFSHPGFYFLSVSSKQSMQSLETLGS